MKNRERIKNSRVRHFGLSIFASSFFVDFALKDEWKIMDLKKGGEVDKPNSSTASANSPTAKFGDLKIPFFLIEKNETISWKLF